MATISLQKAKVAGTISGNSPEVRYFLEASAQSFKSGQFVYLSSGKVAACADNTASVLGMAVHDASGEENKKIAVFVANKDTVFEMNVYHATPASAITAITQLGGKYGLEVDDNKCYLNLASTSDVAFQVRDFSPKDSVGDTYGRVHIQVLTDISQLGAGEKTA